ncbi:PorT family protein [Ferruginibacter lapsinanis]|uniref:PorT family protein n=1 Tax=Ferruginibacter lapsinanis TaxID=563172 RepID=UPI001E3BA44B|nr:PorT family protein [Ferruginibacter lapsinanis]UEG49511.1 PorT family protein [Ferruginibacter lapsinanis]
MKEKSVDHIENKMREAAENYQPVFDEENWGRMEQLLDKDNRRRRPFVWFILAGAFLVLGGGYFLYTAQVPAAVELPQASLSVNEKKQNDLQNNTDKKSADKENVVADKIIPDILPNKKDQDKITTTTTTTTTTKFPNRLVSAGKYKMTVNKNVPDDYDNPTANPDTQKNANDLSVSVTAAATDKKDDEGNVDQNNISVNDALSITSVQNDISPALNIQSKKKEKPADTALAKTAATKPKIESKKARSSFYLFASIGPDQCGVSSFTSSDPTILPKYSIGGGYQLNKKFSIQTGFNFMPKKYIALPGDYKAKPGTYWANAYVQKVKADCYVFEIPLAVRYNIVQNSKRIFYATTGLSSFIMKREDYSYYYTRGSSSYEVYQSISGNKNLFSVFTLSVGLEKKTSSVFSFFAEPNMTMPLSGIGEGSIKLYSLGVQIGAKYMFSKKK